VVAACWAFGLHWMLLFELFHEEVNLQLKWHLDGRDVLPILRLEYFSCWVVWNMVCWFVILLHYLWLE